MDRFGGRTAVRTKKVRYAIRCSRRIRIACRRRRERPGNQSKTALGGVAARASVPTRPRSAPGPLRRHFGKPPGRPGASHECPGRPRGEHPGGTSECPGSPSGRPGGLRSDLGSIWARFGLDLGSICVDFGSIGVDFALDFAARWLTIRRGFFFDRAHGSDDHATICLPPE